MDKTWKKRERQVAGFFDTTRAPLSGLNGRQTASDTLHDRLFIETKYRQRHAAWSLFREVREKARKENKTPVLALSERGKHGFLLCIHSDDIGRFIAAME